MAFENGARDVRTHQQVWVLDGAIDVTLGADRHRLRAGDCLAMELDRPTMFHNPTRKPTRYAVVIASSRSCAARRMDAPMSPPAWSLRRLHAARRGPRRRRSPTCLIDCVDGGASVSFMHPFTRERAVAFWRRVAAGWPPATARSLVAEDAHGICGTVQLVLDLPENQPHRARISRRCWSIAAPAAAGSARR